MPKANKWLYLHVVQGEYGHGWEDVCAEETYREALARRREYNENEPKYPHRIIARREPNPEHPDNQTEGENHV